MISATSSATSVRAKRPLLLVALAALSLFVAIFPLWIIQPFKSQDPHTLPFALAAFRLGPWITLLCLGLALWVAAGAFQQRRGRIAAVVCLVVIAASAAIARVNVFEKMFHPAGEPVFVPAAMLHLAGTDTLLSVTLRGVTHGYPVRAIAYHHIINDRLAGDPIVATY